MHDTNGGVAFLNSFTHKLISHPIYQEAYQRIVECEMGRVYCLHDLPHFIDVARLMWIYNLEQDMQLSKNAIYATALLHDLGRCEQYTNGTPHPEASARLARRILEDLRVPIDNIEEIVEAIEQHRHKPSGNIQDLKSLLYFADKKSRLCFNCQARAGCKWSDEQKNLEMEY